MMFVRALCFCFFSFSGRLSKGGLFFGSHLCFGNIALLFFAFCPGKNMSSCSKGFIDGGCVYHPCFQKGKLIITCPFSLRKKASASNVGKTFLFIARPFLQ